MPDQIRVPQLRGLYLTNEMLVRREFSGAIAMLMAKEKINEEDLRQILTDAVTIARSVGKREGRLGVDLQDRRHLQ